MLTVTLYTRENCHLCEQARDDLLSLQGQVPHELVEIDIDSDPVLQKKYLAEIPVVEVGPYRKVAPFTRADLQVTLYAARDRTDQLEKVGDSVYRKRQEQGQIISGMDNFSLAGCGSG